MLNLICRQFLALILLCVSFSAWAGPTLTLQPTYAEVGQNVTVKVLFSGGTEAYSGINARVKLPQGYSFVSASKGELLSSGLFSLFADSYNDSTGSGVSFVVYSAISSLQNDGALIELVLNAPTNASLGKTPLSFESQTPVTNINVQHAISDNSGERSVAHDIKSGVLYVVSSSSDQDNDGIPDITDEDDDKDGISDVYELANNLDPFVQDATADLDNDGFDNLTEFQQGTSSTDANSLPTRIELSLVAKVTRVIDPNSVLSNVAVGSKLTGILKLLSPGGIDQQALNNNIGEFYQSSSNALLSLEVEGQSFVSQAGTEVMIQIDDGNTNGDAIFVGAANDASSLLALNSYDIALSLGDSTAIALSDDIVPEAIPALGSFDTKTILITGKDSQNSTFEIGAEITSYSVASAVNLDVDGDGDTDTFDLLLIQRHVGGLSNLLLNIKPVTGVGGSGENGSRTNDELRTVINQILQNTSLDVDGDNDSDTFDLLLIQRHVGGLSNLLLNIKPVTGVGGSGADGSYTNEELRMGIDALLGN